MPAMKYTDRGLDALVKQRHSTRVDYFDSATQGLCLRVGARAATWYYFRRVNGKLVRIALGTYAELGSSKGRASFTVARELAGKVESTLAAGLHPKAEQARQRAADRESRDLDHDRMVKRVAEAWKAQHLQKLAATTAAAYAREIAGFVAAFGDQDIGTVKRGHVVRYLDSINKRSPTGASANRAAVVIRLLFAFARDRYDLESNPVADIRNPAKQGKRSRTLDRAEIRILWRACELAGYPHGHALRFALCTGQRIGEVSDIRRSDIDSNGEYWIQTENKPGRRIDLYLASHAQAILADCPNFGAQAPYFSASTDDEGEARPMRRDTWSHAMPRHITPRLAEAAEALGLQPITKPWTPHDLRRTVRTALTGWCHVSPDTAERVLNHAMSGLRANYDHADYRPHVADALKRWDQELAAILNGGKPQVISLSDRKRAKRRTG